MVRVFSLSKASTFSAWHLLGVAATSFVSCMHSPPGPPLTGAPQSIEPSAPSLRPLVVLVVIDGVRWQDVFHGANQAWLATPTAPTREQLVPEIAALEREGATLGAPGTTGFFASGPNFVSLPGYMEMLSGSRRTGCTENDCRSVPRATLLDEFHAESADPSRAGVFSSWPRLEHAAAAERGNGVVSAGPSGGYNHDVLSKYPSAAHWLNLGASEQEQGGLRKDTTTGHLARAFLHEASPDFVFVSLGETDEHAHGGDYTGYLAALKSADAYIGQLRRDLRAIEKKGRDTALFVTTDHGRAYHFTDHGRTYPESARSFLIAGGSTIRKAGRLDTLRSALSDIAPTIRVLSGLPPRPGADQGRVLSEILKY